MDKIEELKQLKSLLDHGAITQEEFDALKRKVLLTEQDIHPIEETAKSALPNNQESREKIKKDLSANPKKTAKKAPKKAVDEKFEAGNETTVSLLKIGLGLSALTGIVFWIRYDTFVALLIVAIVGIGASLAIPRVIPKLWFKNLLLVFVSIIMILLLFVPIGETANLSSESSSSSTDDMAVLHCKWCKATIYEQGNEGIVCYTHEQGGCAYVHFYSGTKYAFCSDRCCELYKSIDY